MAFIVPKDRILLYDEMYNKGPELIENIPRGIATIAGVLNNIERGMISIIDTSSDPSVSGRLNSGGTGFMMLDISGEGALSFVSSYVLNSIMKYNEDCLFLEIAKGGNTLTPADVIEGKKNAIGIINAASNPAVFTCYYDTSNTMVCDNPGGMPVTCYDAAGVIAGYLSSQSEQEKLYDGICKSWGFDSPLAIFQCKNLVESTIRNIGFTTFSYDPRQYFYMQAVLNEVLADQIRTGNAPGVVSTLGSRDTGSSFLGAIIHANTWIPVIKASLSALAVSITPFVLLFAATPLIGRALSLLAGMFIWLTTWGLLMF